MAVPTIRNGMIATTGTNAVNSDQLVVDILDRIFTIDPKSSPMLTVLSARSKSKPAEAVEIKHLEDQPIPEWDLVNDASGMTSGDTEMVVDNGPYHRVGDVLLIPRTGEYVKVTVVATNTLTITRSFASSTAAAIVDNEPILNLGAPEQQGSSAPTAKATVTATQSNYVQIKRTPVHLSRTLDQVKLYGQNERARLRARAAAEHARDWEQILLHGKKSADVSGAKPIYTTNGIDQHIVTNVLDANGTLTESELVDFVGDTFRYKVDGGSGSKAMLCSREVLATISSWGGSKLQTSPGTGKYGFGVTQFVTAFGTLDCINHPLLENGYAGYAYIVDMAGILMRPLQRTILKTNIQAPDFDGYIDEYLTEMGFSFINEQAFGKIYDVSF